MSDKLDPKPTERKLHTISELNDYLQLMFSKGSSKSVSIAVDSYNVSKEDLITKLENANYTVEDSGTHLTIS